MHLLTISPDRHLADSLQSALGEESCELLAPAPPEELLPRILARTPDAVLYDAAADPAGLPSLLSAYRSAAAPPPLLILLSQDRRQEGLDAVRDGAFDYLLQPLALDELALRIRRAQELGHARQEASRLRAVLERESARGQLVAESPAMVALRERAAALAAQRCHVLIRGEPGSGRKTLAEYLHRSGGGGRTPLRVIPCAELSAEILEGTLFRRPAPADPRLPPPALEGQSEDATVVLEGIGNVPAALQERIAAFLREQDEQSPRKPGAPWVRLVVLAAPARADADSEIAGGLQRLFHEAVLEVPPLRERPQDVAALLAHFAQRAAQRLGRPVSVSPRALAMLSVYAWPGNVRELESAVDHAARLAGNGRLEYADFGLMALPSAPSDSGTDGSLALKPQVEAFERQVIMQALAAAKGSRRNAARLLGISLRTLFYKIRRYGLERARQN